MSCNSSVEPVTSITTDRSPRRSLVQQNAWGVKLTDVIVASCESRGKAKERKVVPANCGLSHTIEDAKYATLWNIPSNAENICSKFTGVWNLWQCLSTVSSACALGPSGDEPRTVFLAAWMLQNERFFLSFFFFFFPTLNLWKNS